MPFVTSLDEEIGFKLHNICFDVHVDDVKDCVPGWIAALLGWRHPRSKSS